MLPCQTIRTRAGKPRLRAFRHHPGETGGSAESNRRRYEITQLAFLLLGGRTAAAKFLTSSHEQLGGCPLTIAMTSVEGHIGVARTIRRLALSPGATRQ